MNNCIILHLFYQDLWPEFKNYLSKIVDENNHLYISICGIEEEYYEDMKSLAKEVYVLPNKGFDFGPFVYVYNKIKDKDYNSITKLHGKKSLHSPGLANIWRPGLYMPLIGTKESYLDITNYMAENEKVFMVGPEKYFTMETIESPNYIAIIDYLKPLYDIIKVENKEKGFFFAGSMFVCSKKYLDLLFKDVDLESLYEMFEDGYHRVSLAHGMERMIGFGVIELGGEFALI